MVIYKELDLRGLYQAAVQSAITTAQVMVLLAGASVFGWLLTVGQIPQDLTKLVIESNSSPVMFLIGINIILILAGMFIDGSSAIVILAPLVYPIALQLGIDPVHLGVIMVANAAIGMFTPPFGLNLFVAAFTTGLPIIDIMKAVMPFVAISILVLLLITYIPDVSLLLPKMVYGN
ncbi:MAG: TRAP transporter large permease subunit [Clostridia bacterium]|nr:TRAP transporter large permease subunit [Clostridia bacterium]